MKWNGWGRAEYLGGRASPAVSGPRAHRGLWFTGVQLLHQRGHGVGDGVGRHQEVVPQVPPGAWEQEKRGKRKEGYCTHLPQLWSDITVRTADEAPVYPHPGKKPPERHCPPRPGRPEEGRPERVETRRLRGAGWMGWACEGPPERNRLPVPGTPGEAFHKHSRLKAAACSLSCA